ncbi:MAG: tRNA (guanosine(37)-N1)-methyltransferase TrmD [Patescibacteria group bacterium]
MNFEVFTLHPDLFQSFTNESLIARGISKEIIRLNTHNFRDFGIGGYKAVDDRPFGGGNGMVLRPEPIFQSLQETNLLSTLFAFPVDGNIQTHHRLYPNNAKFEDLVRSGQLQNRKVTISLTPRGFPLNQAIVEWVAENFDQVGIMCGRYEGFDARVSEMVDLEISLGDYVLNGGEVGAMVLIEAIARLVPGFITKSGSVQHDSFSSHLNNYLEHGEYVIGKNRMQELAKHNPDKLKQMQSVESQNKAIQLFSNEYWLKSIAPRIEHPQYTRPENWNGWQVPTVLLSGDHKLIDAWRKKGWRNILEN